MRRFGFRPRRRGGFRRAVQRVVGRTLVKRINIDKLAIPDITSADYDNPLTIDLIQGIEAQDEGQVSDGTIIADAPLYSKVFALHVRGFIAGSSAGGEQVRWILFKNPDGDITGAAAMADWHNSDEDSAARELRKNTLAKGVLRISSSNLGTPMKIFIKRRTLARLGRMNETDTIRLVLAKDATNTTLQLTMFGSIYLRTN